MGLLTTFKRTKHLPYCYFLHINFRLIIIIFSCILKTAFYLNNSTSATNFIVIYSHLLPFYQINFSFDFHRTIEFIFNFTITFDFDFYFANYYKM